MAVTDLTIRRPHLLLTVIVLLAPLLAPAQQRQGPGGAMLSTSLDPRSVVERSAIVLLRPNLLPSQAMPLGNGRLGVAVWGERGFTAQLNRADTLPGRLSPGQIVLPGLERLVSAANYCGRLDLYDGEFVEHGAGMTATAFLDPDDDVLVVDVTGADPSALQTATLRLWPPRAPTATVAGKTGILEETWKDSTDAGATGETFGSLAAIAAQGRDVQARVDSPLAVTLSFRPQPDGSFRVLAAAPSWRDGDAASAAARVLAAASKVPAEAHRRRRHAFWSQTGLMRLSSKDGSAEYMENLRIVDLYTAAADSLGRLPGSQAGVADMFSAFRDTHKWDPSAYWHWNLRMQVAANLGAGAYRLNLPYFRLYRQNLPRIEQWTKLHMSHRAGICVPETMRFNGAGYENETWTKSAALDCAEDSAPYYNARTLSTGAEVSLWIWQQYLATADRAFLAENYPVMEESARFLLAYATTGSNGRLQTSPSNAHETQWDVRDPTTDIAAMSALFPALLQAAEVLHRNSPLLAQVRAALGHIAPLPRTDEATRKILLGAAADGDGHDVIAPSYEPGAPMQNSENVGLEPVWPYSLIADDGPLHSLALRTFLHRPFQTENDWSFDPIHAARLGLSDTVKSTLIALTERYQAYPSGLAQFVGPEFYVEQIGVAAAALQEALAQDYDGVLRIAPAWPKDWDADGVVFIRNRSAVEVQMRDGRPLRAVIHAGYSGAFRLRDPWAGSSTGSPLAITEGGHAVPMRMHGSVAEFHVDAGRSYLVGTSGQVQAAAQQRIPGQAAQAPKHLGRRSIGLDRTHP